MQDFDDLEPSDEELEKLEEEMKEKSLPVDIEGAYNLYSLQTNRIETLAGIIVEMVQHSELEAVRQSVEHELKLIMGDTTAFKVARIAALRAAHEGISLED